MDDGYADGNRQHDRADLAEKRVAIAQLALKAIGRRYTHTAPAVKLALKQMDEAVLTVSDIT